MKSNLNKLTNKLKTIGKNFAIPISSLNELNQVSIALKRAGYEGLFSSDYKRKQFRNHITEAKYFCYDSNDGIQKYPIGLSCYNSQGEDKGYMIVNWDVKGTYYCNTIVEL